MAFFRNKITVTAVVEEDRDTRITVTTTVPDGADLPAVFGELIGAAKNVQATTRDKYGYPINN